MFSAFATKAHALLISSVDAGLGFSTYKLNYSGLTHSMTSTSTIELNYVLKHSALSSAYTLSFMEMLSESNRQLPFTKLAFGYRWYPMGMNGGRLILDQGAIAQVWKATPFALLSMGMTNVSIPEFNATLIDTTLGFGAELPLNTQTLIQAQLGLHTGNSTASSQARAISYQGMSVIFSLIFLGF